MQVIISGKYNELYKDFENEGLELDFGKGKLILPEPSELLMENATIKAQEAIKQMPEYDYALGDDSRGIYRIS